MNIGDINGKLLVELEDVMVTTEQATAARATVRALVPDANERGTFLDMLGLGDEPAWNMGQAS